MNNSSKISMHLTKTTLNIYNELEGIFSFALPQMNNSGTILDSLKTMAEVKEEEDIILSAADDTIKILYSQTDEIQIINGLKNFASSIVSNELEE
jgi:hypothetical protein